jgi:hypothetical protein
MIATANGKDKGEESKAIGPAFVHGEVTVQRVTIDRGALVEAKVDGQPIQFRVESKELATFSRFRDACLKRHQLFVQFEEGERSRVRSRNWSDMIADAWRAGAEGAK